MAIRINTGTTSQRIGIIGGSDIGAILGLSQFNTPLDIYNNYNGVVRPEPSEEAQKSMAMGTFFEDSICRFHAESRGWKIHRSNLAYQSPEHDWLVLHPDRIINGFVDIDGNPLDAKKRDPEHGVYKAAMECKFVSSFSAGWGTPGTDEIPDYIMAQCCGYFLCDVCDVVFVVRMQGNRIEEFPVFPDKEILEAVEEGLVKFYKEHLLPGIPPLPSTPEEAIKRWSCPTEESIVADESVIAAINDLKAAKEKEKEGKAEEDIAKTAIMNLMQDKSYVVSEDGNKLLSWKASKSTRFDKKTLAIDYPDIVEKYSVISVSRTMRISNSKKKGNK